VLKKADNLSWNISMPETVALIKSLGVLPEEWAKNYDAEVDSRYCLEYLHQRDIIQHTEPDPHCVRLTDVIYLKPDDLLIDQHLTDFGLSRIDPLRSQTRDAQMMMLGHGGCADQAPPSMDLAHLIAVDIVGHSYFNQQSATVHRQTPNSFIHQ
jgi:serine/threonine protein kinase